MWGERESAGHRSRKAIVTLTLAGLLSLTGAQVASADQRAADERAPDGWTCLTPITASSGVQRGPGNEALYQASGCTAPLDRPGGPSATPTATVSSDPPQRARRGVARGTGLVSRRRAHRRFKGKARGTRRHS